MAEPLVYIDAGQLHKLQQELRKFEPKALTTLRREVKRIGEKAVQAVEKAVMEDPPGGDSVPGSDARAAIASAVSMKLSFGKRTSGVAVVASGKNLGVNAQFLGAYNQNQWNHKVFGREPKVTQYGHPYFGAAITPIVDDEMLGALAAAFDKAAQAIGARTR